MVYMVIENFKNYDALPVYRRFKEKGRLAPEGLVYLSSWVDEKFRLCFQLVETDDRALLDHTKSIRVGSCNFVDSSLM
ncbi:MAG TPA: DUF3303 family protein [Pyrinomonadaceae bacterium]|nr:DUF3303 family protein [Pyrinomonadaceae bacterium]